MSDAAVAVNGASAPAPAAEPTPQPNIFGGSDIVIKRKRNHHEIEIDMDKLTWADAKKMSKVRAATKSGQMSDDEATSILDDLVEKVSGRDPNTLPVQVVEKIIEAIFAQDNAASEAEGNSATGSMPISG